jgi:hypothetical protein
MNKDLIGIINSYFSKDLVMNKFPNVEKFDLIYNDPIKYYRGMPYPELAREYLTIDVYIKPTILNCVKSVSDDIFSVYNFLDYFLPNELRLFSVDFNLIDYELILHVWCDDTNRWHKLGGMDSLYGPF